MKSSRYGTSFLSSVLSPVRLVLFVAVAVGVAYLVTHSSPTARRVSLIPTHVATPDSRLPTSGLLLLSDSSATLVDQNGSSTRLTREEFDKRFGIEGHVTEGALAANGSVVLYQNLLRSPDLNRIAKLGTPKADGASVIEIQHESGGFPITLRFGKRALRDARVHGWSDPRHLLVSALVTSTRAIFDVDLTGAVREIAPLPDTVLSLEARRGAIWYITAAPGEGIESEPIPPSELHRISLADGDRLVLRESARLILNAVAGPSNDVAYYANDGQATYLKVGDTASKVAVGKRHPILFLNDGSLILRDGFVLVRADLKTGTASNIGALPEGAIEVYEMPQTR